MIQLLLVLITLIGLVATGTYFYFDITKHKDENVKDFAKVDKDITVEKKDRLSNLKYIVDQINTTHTEMDKDQLDKIDETYEKVETGFGSIIKTTDAENKVVTLGDLPHTPITNIELLNNVSAVGNLKINGNINSDKALNVKGGTSVHNPKNYWTHFPWLDGKNYIRGNTEIAGNVNNIGDLTVGGRTYLVGGKSVHNPNNYWTHFPWDDGKNYIRGDTEIRGNVNNIGDLTVGGTLNVNRINIGTRWTISPEGNSQVLVIRDKLSGGDKRFAFYPNKNKDI